MKKGVKIISAEKQHWFGGVKGVQGDNFIIKLQSKKANDIKFLSLNYNGNSLPVQVKKEGNKIEVKASYSEDRSQPQISLQSDGSVSANKEVEITDKKTQVSFLKYELNTKVDTLEIHQYKEIPMEEPLIP